MFDFDAGKLIVIGIVALIAIPSKDLPRVLRTLGQATGRMRRMAAEFQGQLSEALREAELADLKQEFEETNRKIMKSVKLDGSFDPLAEARKQIVSAVEEEPHPEEPRSGVSKDAAELARAASSFETRPAVAPQDEARSEAETRASSDQESTEPDKKASSP